MSVRGWSIVVYNDITHEHEVCPDVFRTRRNAELQCEGMMVDQVIERDGVFRLERSDPIFSTDTAIQKIADDESIMFFSAHYITSTPFPWKLTLKRVQIYPLITIITEDIEDKMIVDVDEEYQEEAEVKVVVPGRFYNGHRKEKMMLTKTRKVQKEVTTTRRDEKSIRHRKVLVENVMSVYLARSTLNEPEEENRIQIPMYANLLATTFALSNTSKLLLEGGKTVSELIKLNPREFDTYTPKKSLNEISWGSSWNMSPLYTPATKINEVAHTKKQTNSSRDASAGIAGLANEVAEIARHKASYIPFWDAV